MIFHQFIRKHVWKYVAPIFAKKKIPSSFFTFDKSDEMGRQAMEILFHGTDALSRDVCRNFFVPKFLLHKMATENWCVLVNADDAQSFLVEYSGIGELAAQEAQRITELARAYDIKYQFPTDSTINSIHLATHYGLRVFFPAEALQTIRGRDVIDGGGYCGDSAMVFTEYDPKTVHVFEANPDSFPVLKETITKNASVLGDRFSKILPVPSALGREKG